MLVLDGNLGGSTFFTAKEGKLAREFWYTRWSWTLAFLYFFKYVVFEGYIYT